MYKKNTNRQKTKRTRTYIFAQNRFSFYFRNKNIELYKAVAKQAETVLYFRNFCYCYLLCPQYRLIFVQNFFRDRKIACRVRRNTLYISKTVKQDKIKKKQAEKKEEEG